MHVRYANATEKQPCIFELSTYSGINTAGLGFLNTIVRDNCQTARFFCDTTSQLCERLRLVGQRCQYHRDCQSVRFRVPFLFSIFKAESHVQYNCIQNVCADPPEEPFEVALWQYVATTLAVVLGKVAFLFQDNGLRRPVSKCTAMATTCTMLVMMHRRHRLKHYKEVYDYCDEQLRHVSSLSNWYIHRPFTWGQTDFGSQFSV
jgi:hypothetical protein